MPCCGRRSVCSLGRRSPSRPTLAATRALPALSRKLDDQLSKRPLELDAAGYYIVKLDPDAKEIVAQYYTNTVNKDGLACDPETGEVIPCHAGYVRPATKEFRAKSAKELSVQVLEQDDSGERCTHLEHANYLGREFQKAEFALLLGEEYVQD